MSDRAEDREGCGEGNCGCNRVSVRAMPRQICGWTGEGAEFVGVGDGIGDERSNPSRERGFGDDDARRGCRDEGVREDIHSNLGSG